jgi:protein-arginine kinase activator protein McsA
MEEKQSVVNIHLRPQEGEDAKTETLVCNWCHLPHKVEPEYKQDILVRAAERLAEALEAGGLTDDERALKPEDTWTCGKCMVQLLGLPTTTRTECPEHEVPNAS